MVLQKKRLVGVILPPNTEITELEFPLRGTNSITVACDEVNDPTGTVAIDQIEIYNEGKFFVMNLAIYSSCSISVVIVAVM